MNRVLALLLAALTIPLYVSAQEPASIRTEMSKVDALAADPELKLVVVTSMAGALHVHRNHVLLLRRETGQSFAAIFVSELRARGMDDAAVLRNLQDVGRGVERKVASEEVAPSAAVRPVLLVDSAIDHNSAATVYSLRPEAGIDSRHVAAVVGVPYYRISDSSISNSGVGDVYGSVFLRGGAAKFELGSALTVGAPTGNRDKGLGAGKVTVDVAGTVARRFEFVRPWVSAGFANSVFNNVGYQRPYITDGSVAHFSGGFDFQLPRRAVFGLTGFGLEPVGGESVYTQTVAHPPSQNNGGMMSGGMGNGGTLPPPSYNGPQQSVVSASDVRDYGASAWVSVPLHTGFTLNAAIARSAPFHLTTVRIGIGIDVARLIFPRKRF